MTTKQPILSHNAFDGTLGEGIDETTRGLLERRQRNFGAASVLFYRDPITIERAEGAWIYGSDGNRYLDLYNNVPVLGHSHPRVTAAVSEQIAKVSVSTRYLHEILEQYAERLLGTFPAHLSNVVLSCTGTEANDLALRIATAKSGGRGFIVSNRAYHGNSAAVSDISPSAQRGALPAHVRLVPPPGREFYGEDIAGGFATAIKGAIADLNASGHGFGGAIFDMIFSSDGVFADPTGMLNPAVDAVRDAGGLFIADEVQPGFGRTGDAMWCWQRQGIDPDIVTMGKPMGNGFPIAGLVTRPELLSRFCENIGYFNTFGGNPVAAAAGLAVLDVLHDEGLLENARARGEEMRARIAGLSSRFPQVGEVRGAGLFIGVDIVRDGKPDKAECMRTVNGLRHRGVLIGSAGANGNVWKIRPPLSIQSAEIDFFLSAVEETLKSES